MAIVALTSDQRIAMKSNQRYKNLVRVAVENQAAYWQGNDGTAYASAADRARWAKSRYMGAQIIFYPDAPGYDAWVSRFTIILKNMLVVDNVANPDDQAPGFYDAVLDYMLINGKFEELADLSFNVEINKILF